MLFNYYLLCKISNTIFFQLLFGTTDPQNLNFTTQDSNLSLTFDDESHPFGNWHVENWSILKLTEAKSLSPSNSLSNTSNMTKEIAATPNPYFSLK